MCGADGGGGNGIRRGERAVHGDIALHVGWQHGLVEGQRSGALLTGMKMREKFSTRPDQRDGAEVVVVVGGVGGGMGSGPKAGREEARRSVCKHLRAVRDEPRDVRSAHPSP